MELIENSRRFAERLGGKTVEYEQGGASVKITLRPLTLPQYHFLGAINGAKSDKTDPLEKAVEEAIFASEAMLWTLRFGIDSIEGLKGSRFVTERAGGRCECPDIQTIGLFPTQIQTEIYTALADMMNLDEDEVNKLDFTTEPPATTETDAEAASPAEPAS